MKQKIREENRRNFIVALIVVILLIVIAIFIGNVFARYNSKESNGTVDDSPWIVKVNHIDVTTANIVNFANLRLTPNSNDNVVGEGMNSFTTASTSFSIDPTGSEVEMEYEIAFGPVSTSSKNISNDFEITEVKAEKTNLTQTAGKYLGKISLPSSGAMTEEQTVTVFITVSWKNDDIQKETDTNSVTPILTVPVTVTIRQKTI